MRSNPKTICLINPTDCHSPKGLRNDSEESMDCHVATAPRNDNEESMDSYEN
ncbi:MAG: hypothetical protein IKV11_00480 [Alphaproteobacteria bacterium]|nr:hypothetical protein [Alphaproteobacteria bacterium]